MQFVVVVKAATLCNISIDGTLLNISSNVRGQIQCPSGVGCTLVSDDMFSLTPAKNYSSMSHVVRDFWLMSRQGYQLSNQTVREDIAICAVGDTAEECRRYCRVPCVLNPAPGTYSYQLEYDGYGPELNLNNAMPAWWCPKGVERYTDESRNLQDEYVAAVRSGAIKPTGDVSKKNYSVSCLSHAQIKGVEFSGWASVRMTCPAAVECVELQLRDFGAKNLSWAAGQLAAMLHMAQIEEEFVNASAYVQICALGTTRDECLRYCNRTCIKQDKMEPVFWEHRFFWTLNRTDGYSVDNGTNLRQLDDYRYYCPRGSGIKPLHTHFYPLWAYNIWGWPTKVIGLIIAGCLVGVVIIVVVGCLIGKKVTKVWCICCCDVPQENMPQGMRQRVEKRELQGARRGVM